MALPGFAIQQNGRRVNPPPVSAGAVLMRPRKGLADHFETALPKLVLGPTLLCALIFVYGFILWTAWLSFTESRLLPRYEFAGLVQYVTLFANERWWTALRNLGIFGSLFIALCLVTGLLLAILLDQRIRAEGFLRAVYLYPMALSFIVTGTAWRWILNPGLGFEHLVRQLGFEHFTLRLDRDARNVYLRGGDRGRVAVDGLRDGAVPGRLARH